MLIDRCLVYARIAPRFVSLPISLPQENDRFCTRPFNIHQATGPRTVSDSPYRDNTASPDDTRSLITAGSAHGTLQFG
jgi:hypothetical protein